MEPRDVSCLSGMSWGSLGKHQSFAAIQWGNQTHRSSFQQREGKNAVFPARFRLSQGGWGCGCLTLQGPMNKDTAGPQPPPKRGTLAEILLGTLRWPCLSLLAHCTSNWTARSCLWHFGGYCYHVSNVHIWPS